MCYWVLMYCVMYWLFEYCFTTITTIFPCVMTGEIHTVLHVRSDSSQNGVKIQYSTKCIWIVPSCWELQWSLLVSSADCEARILHKTVLQPHPFSYISHYTRRTVMLTKCDTSRVQCKSCGQGKITLKYFN